ncbi:hypothetical protein ACH5RR_033836 [Cinchona calisaya]|uniref:CCHC-type domain-containing protein n=1 Tax=Cinchona calisaya TaxID=153742 RepID=A0ABD2YDT3_9GENT
MTDERKVRFIIKKFIGQIQIWWKGVEYDLRFQGQVGITWEEMKLLSKRKYLPEQYLFDDLTSLSIKLGLRPEIRNQFIGHRIWTVNEAFQLALQFEKILRQPPIRNFTPEAGEINTKRFAATGKFYKPTNLQVTYKIADPRNKPPMVDEQRKDNKDECFKCGLKGHTVFE